MEPIKQEQLEIGESAEDHRALERVYIYSKTFDEIMTDDFKEYVYAGGGYSFRGTMNLKIALNALRFEYKRGYHSGLSRVFRYGFSIHEHENHLQIRHIDQLRCTASRQGNTIEQREAFSAIWGSRPKTLCPDLARTCMISVTIDEHLTQAVTANADVLNICSADMCIVILYTALSRCTRIDEFTRGEANRFLAAYRNSVSLCSVMLANCGVESL